MLATEWAFQRAPEKVRLVGERDQTEWITAVARGRRVSIYCRGGSEVLEDQDRVDILRD